MLAIIAFLSSDAVSASVLQYRFSDNFNRISIRMSGVGVAETLLRLSRSGAFTISGLERISHSKTLKLDDVSIPFLLTRLLQKQPYIANFAATQNGPRLAHLRILAPSVNLASPTARGEDSPVHAQLKSNSVAPVVAESVGIGPDTARELKRVQRTARRRDAKAAHEFIEIALNARDPRVRNQAASQLESRVAQITSPDLARLLKSRDGAIRKSALRALAQKKDTEARKLLETAYENARDDASERVLAIYGLGAFRDRAAIRFLQTTLARETDEVREVVLRTLERIGG